MPGEPRYGIDPYMDWLARERLPVVEDYAIDLFAVETRPWARFGGKGAAVHCKGRGDFSNLFLMELSAGSASAPQQHLYEEIVYVLEGHGSTQIELAGGRKHSFEWGPRSLFGIPLNAKHRYFNGAGNARALVVSTTNLPIVYNIFRNEQFIFGSSSEFPEREGKVEYFTGGGDLLLVRPGNHMWETNFVPDLGEVELQPWGDRGAGATNIKFVLADSTMHAHLSEMPPGTYKKAHRHPAGFHVMCVGGHGYSLMWFEGDNDFLRIDWKHGVVFPPADQQLHQHFTTSAEPARYLATAFGSLRYPITLANRRTFIGLKAGEKQAVSRSVKEGGDQIEYEDQDSRVHELWLDEMKKAGLQPRMDDYAVHLRR